MRRPTENQIIVFVAVGLGLLLVIPVVLLVTIFNPMPYFGDH